MSSTLVVRPVLAGSLTLGLLSLGACSTPSEESSEGAGSRGDASASSSEGSGESSDASDESSMGESEDTTEGTTSSGTTSTSSGGTVTGTTTGGTSTSGGSSTSSTSGGDTTGPVTGEDSTGGTEGSGEVDGGGEFTLVSSELEDLGMFAEINTCAGNTGAMGFGEAIPLEWSGFPEGTQSFALTMIDITLVDQQSDYLGCHSAFWNVPVTTTSMPDQDWASALTGAMQIRNGYLGPCPNFGGGTNEDTYVFTLYAMGDANFSDPAVTTTAFGSLDGCNAFRQALEDNALATATLTGTSNASR